MEPLEQWRSRRGFKGEGGQSAPPGSEKMPKSREKSGKKREKIGKKGQKSGIVFSLSSS